MPGLRLLADDLTGALDCAAAFAPAFGKVRVVWDEAAGDLASTATLAFDTATRERDAEAASWRLAALTPILAGGPADVTRFFKVDSLLRGHAGHELLAVLSARPFTRVVIAPAIPFQRRITRDGRQLIDDGGEWHPTGEDIGETLRAGGEIVTRCRPGHAMPPGISLWDAETDTDLDAIVESAGGEPDILWVGAAGLAAALSRALGVSGTSLPLRATPLPPSPLLGLIGTDHHATRNQLAHSAAHHLRIGEDAVDAAARVNLRLSQGDGVFVTCDLSPGLARAAMEAIIAERFAALVRRLERPVSLFVSGGETLRGFASRTGARAIDCIGQFETGAPISLIVGGTCDGMTLVSKSGAFGTADFLSRLVAAMATASKAST